MSSGIKVPAIDQIGPHNTHLVVNALATQAQTDVNAIINGTLHGASSTNLVSLNATAPAQLLGNMPATVAGTVKTAKLILGQTRFAAGESVSIMLKKNGTNLLSSPMTLDSTALANAVVDASANIVGGQAAIAVGDEITAAITYTAGGGPNHPNLTIQVLWS